MKMLFTAWVIWIILGPHEVEGEPNFISGRNDIPLFTVTRRKILLELV